MMLGNLDSYMQKNETWSPTYTIHKNKLKMDKRCKYKSWYHKSPRGEYRQENLGYSMQQYFHQYVPYSKEHKGKNKQMGSHQNKKASAQLNKTALKWKENQPYGKT